MSDATSRASVASMCRYWSLESINDPLMSAVDYLGLKFCLERAADLLAAPVVPLAVMLASERVRADAANTMRHDTTSDLSARLMCRVAVSDIGLVLAWLDQHRSEVAQ